MSDFILTPQLRAKRRQMRLEMALLMLKKKIFGKLSEADEKRHKEIMLELSKHY